MPPRTSSRTRSPRSVPPGSRVSTTSRPDSSRCCRRSSDWVVVPEPSSPSKVTNTRLGYEPWRSWSPEARGSSARTSRRRSSRAARTSWSSTTSRRASARTSRRASSFVEGDVREPQDELFAGVKPTVCYHLAAQIDVRVSVARPDHDAHINVLGTVNVLQAALEHGTQVVFSSTGGAIYGECDGPASEDAPRRPIAPYGTAKLAAEEYLATYNRLLRDTARLAALRKRVRAAAGPARRGRGRRDLLQHAARGRAAEDLRRRLGDARLRVRRRRRARDAAAAGGHDGGVYNVGTGRETSVVELLELCQRIAGTSIRGGVHASAAGRDPAQRPRSERAPSTSSAGGRAQPRGRPPRDLGVLPRLAGTPRVGRIRSVPWRLSAPELRPPRSRTAHPRFQRHRRVRFCCS